MTRPVATFSIVGTDPLTGEAGVAVASKFLAVGAVVPWAKAGVGAVATQAHANTNFGRAGLRLMSDNLAPADVIRRLTESDEGRDSRQVGMVAANGMSATFTGPQCATWAGGISGDSFAAQGNILAGPFVVEAMAASFRSSSGSLTDRLLAALRAGDQAGGDRRGRQSAALLVVKRGGGYAGFNDRYIDLRVDDNADPIAELIRLREMHRLYFDRPGEADTIEVTPVIALQIQDLLRSTGDITGSSSGVYDETTRLALNSVYNRENLEERWLDGAVIDGVALEYLLSKISKPT